MLIYAPVNSTFHQKFTKIIIRLNHYWCTLTVIFYFLEVHFIIYRIKCKQENIKLFSQDESGSFSKKMCNIIFSWCYNNLCKTHTDLNTKCSSNCIMIIVWMVLPSYLSVIIYVHLFTHSVCFFDVNSCNKIFLV